MKTPIIEDRTLARVARDAIGWDDGVTPAAERAEMALGRAVLALRAMGVAATREVTRAVRDDIAILLAPAPRQVRLAAWRPRFAANPRAASGDVRARRA